MVPLFVFAILGLAGLFFVGLLASVLFRGERPRPDDTPVSSEEAGLKEPEVLLGAEDKFRVRFETSAGAFVVQVNPEWAPRGATQFRELVEAGFFDQNRFFRVVPKFIVQFGINGDPAEQNKWRQPIPDDRLGHSNTKGTLAFANSGPNTRTTQMFINLEDNTKTLDSQVGFTPFGEVVEGMDIVEKINPEYGEQPNQGEIQSQGNDYLTRQFPRLDYIISAKIVQ
jgi:cyclophilin family peptidyl-prolyl cis-trans isomerase